MNGRCVFALLLIITLAASHLGAQQIPPLEDLGRTPLNTGYPRLNLGYPTRNLVDPEVGRGGRLAQGFSEPDFTYSFNHPLARYENPLFNTGPYGTVNSSLRPAGPEDLPNPASSRRSSGLQLSVSPHDPVGDVQFLPAPWVQAAKKSTYTPKLGVYAHPVTDHKVKGAYVTGIAIDGTGHRAGLLPGDVITHINGHQLMSTEDYQNAMDGLAKPWSLKVWNSHTNRTTTLQSSER